MQNYCGCGREEILRRATLSQNDKSYVVVFLREAGCFALQAVKAMESWNMTEGTDEMSRFALHFICPAVTFPPGAMVV